MMDVNIYLNVTASFYKLSSYKSSTAYFSLVIGKLINKQSQISTYLKTKIFKHLLIN